MSTPPFGAGGSQSHIITNAARIGHHLGSRLAPGVSGPWHRLQRAAAVHPNRKTGSSDGIWKVLRHGKFVVGVVVTFRSKRPLHQAIHASSGRVSPMAVEHENEDVSIGDEIRCLLDAGWTWDGDKLVHPEHKDVWTMYIRTFSHMSRVEQVRRRDRSKPYERAQPARTGLIAAMVKADCFRDRHPSPSRSPFRQLRDHAMKRDPIQHRQLARRHRVSWGRVCRFEGSQRPLGQQHLQHHLGLALDLDLVCLPPLGV